MPTTYEQIDKLLRPRGHFFYGWYIVGAAGGVQFLSAFLWMQSYGAYVVLLQQEFGWSKTLVAGAFALTRIESGILGPVQGWLVDRYGPRIILNIGTVLFGLGFMMFSRVDTLIEFYLVFLLIALGSSLGGFATVMVALVNWFDSHRAKAVAWSQVGYSLGGFCVPLLIICLETFGWRVTALYSGILVILLGIPMVQLVRHRPGDYGEVADGAISLTEGNDGNIVRLDQDFTAVKAMRTPAFWFLSVGHACALLTVSAVLVHLVPHLNSELGLSLTSAGLIVAVLTSFQLIAQVLGGFLGDRFNKGLICVLCMFGHAIGLLLLAYASNVWMVLAATAFHGLAWGVRGPLMVALRADYFGPSSFGTIMGFSSLIVMLGMSFGPIYAGYLADTHGNYRLAFSTLALAAVVGALCFALARPPKQKFSLKGSPYGA